MNCRPNSTAESLPRKQEVLGSSPRGGPSAALTTGPSVFDAVVQYAEHIKRQTLTDTLVVQRLGPDGRVLEERVL